eukprot:TRINITY_DN7474_c0_g1_i1.p1 TRINITY_DN7474_c0_g1~~TRINITY_DN7474_c0_g1_i1.p1  ORF type:complete len:935 (-),score=200.49 TRINITY_DN7474_c0_g1_i1:186-2990(-)
MHEFVVRCDNGTQIKIEFPFQPYEQQYGYIGELTKSIIEKKHSLLESPTGTGKSLMILTSILGCQDYLNRESQFNSNLRYRAIILSRTHTQIQQFLKELKHLEKTPTVTVLAARKHYCVWKKMIKEGLYNINQRCTHAQDSCPYFQGFKLRGLSQQPSKTFTDIEDFVTDCRVNRICPYYLSRRNCYSSDIVFSPYSYIFDKASSAGLDMELFLSNATLIVDEAHNLESVCTDSNSCSLDVSQLSAALAEVDVVVTRARHNPMKNTGINVRDATILQLILHGLEQRLSVVEVSNTDKFSNPTRVEETEWVINLFRSLGINRTTYEGLVDQIKLMLVNDLADRVASNSAGSRALRTLIRLFEQVFGSVEEGVSNLFKTLIIDEITSIGAKNLKNKRNVQRRFLNFWCFSSSLAVSKIKTHVRNLVFTSGTISPFSGIEAETNIHFPIQYSAKHVIQRENIVVSVLSKGPDGINLNSSMKNRGNMDYIESLGLLALLQCDVCNGGILFFFPSYSALRSVIKGWKEHKISLDKLRNIPFKREISIFENKTILESIELIRPTFIEPNLSDDLKEVMDAYYYSIKSNLGGIVFAVCRGKLSEGLDFKDDKGRVVIIAGIPFPSVKEPKIVVKREFTSSRNVDWYKLQAMSAVNQAAGRVIRHIHDYGSIILADERFRDTNLQTLISLWLKEFLVVNDNYNVLHGKIMGMLARCGAYAHSMNQVKKKMNGMNLNRSNLRVPMNFRSIKENLKKEPEIPVASLKDEIEDLEKNIFHFKTQDLISTHKDEKTSFAQTPHRLLIASDLNTKESLRDKFTKRLNNSNKSFELLNSSEFREMVPEGKRIVKDIFSNWLAGKFQDEHPSKILLLFRKANVSNEIVLRICEMSKASLIPSALEVRELIELDNQKLAQLWNNSLIQSKKEGKLLKKPNKLALLAQKRK